MIIIDYVIIFYTDVQCYLIIFPCSLISACQHAVETKDVEIVEWVKARTNEKSDALMFLISFLSKHFIFINVIKMLKQHPKALNCFFNRRDDTET